MIIIPKIKCNNCGILVDSSHKFCSKCGSNIHTKTWEKYIFGTGWWARNKWATPLVIILVIIALFFINSYSDTLKKQGTNQNIIQNINQESLKTIKLHIEPLPFGINPTHSNSLREARVYWESKQNVFFKEISSPKEADVLVRWVKEFGGRKLGDTIYSDFIEIGLGDSRCLGKWQPYKYEVVKDIAIHELGHVLGYNDDYNNTNSVMYYTLTTEYETDIEESEVIPDGWTRFYPVCTKRSVASYSIEVTSNEPLDIYVVPDRENYKLLVDGKTFSHYPSCEDNEVEFYRRTCAVPQGGGIALRNPTAFGLGADAQFTIKIKEL